MSLLKQFGLTPIEKKSLKSGHTNKPYFSVSIKGGKTYSFSLYTLFKEGLIDWDGIDIAFSKQHGGLFVAKGNTFKFQDKKDRPGRIDSVDIYNLIWKSFCLKKPETKARVIFSYEKFSEDVYILKVEKIDYNY
jgi:hypothetical protein